MFESDTFYRPFGISFSLGPITSHNTTNNNVKKDVLKKYKRKHLFLFLSSYLLVGALPAMILPYARTTLLLQSLERVL